MSEIRSYVEARITGEGDPMPRTGLDLALNLVSKLYGALVALRLRAYSSGFLEQHRLPRKVISIGNVTVGGTGKTPMTLYVADLLAKAGFRIAILSRGFRGGAEASGGMVSDGNRIYMDTQTAGDEPYLMARRLLGRPVAIFVGRDRKRMGDMAVRSFDPDVILMDDGFQHLKLKRDVDLVLLDARRPLGNGHLLPRGSLREPVTGLQRAAAVILTRCSTEAGRPSREYHSIPNADRCIESKPLFISRHQVAWFRAEGGGAMPNSVGKDIEKIRSMAELRGRRALAFSGIARNSDFKNDLERAGITLSGFRSYPDHYRYMNKDFADIATDAMSGDVDYILTTEKDWVKMPQSLRFAAPLGIVTLETVCEAGEEPLATFLLNALK